MNHDPGDIFEFGSFQVDPTERLLLRDGTPVHITDKAFDALLVLLRKAGHLVDRAELIATIWGQTFVEEGNLTVAISMLRRVLGEHGNHSQYIETVPRRGYRFIADVRKISSSAPELLKSTELAEVECAPIPISGFLRNPSIAALAFALILIGSVSVVLFARAPQAPKAAAARMRSLTVAEPLSATNPRSHQTEDWEAYRLYQEGRYWLNKRTQEGLRQSVRLFQQATARDPEYADAYVGMAESYMAEKAYLSAKASAQKALKLDKSLAEAHTCLGVLSLRYEWNWSNAEIELHDALEATPNDSVALFEHAKALAAVGLLDEALQEARRAQRFDPASLKINNELGRIYYWNRNYDEAISVFHHVLELDPNYERAHTRLGKTYLAKGNYPEAVREFRAGLRLAGNNPYIQGLLGYAEALNGNKKQSLRMLEELRERSHREYVPAFSMVLISLGAGDRQQALASLFKAYKDHSEHLSYAKVDPLFDPFRSDPKFVSLLSHMRLSHTTSAVDLKLSRGPDDFRRGI